MVVCREIDVLVEKNGGIIDELVCKILIINLCCFAEQIIHIFSPEWATYNRQWYEPLLKCPPYKIKP